MVESRDAIWSDMFSRSELAIPHAILNPSQPHTIHNRQARSLPARSRCKIVETNLTCEKLSHRLSRP